VEENHDGRNIHVGNLDNLTRERDLRSIFSRYGEIESATVVLDPHTSPLYWFDAAFFFDSL
jgi:RNA recognition motif-containing protein